jgi:hypothetical protein
VFPEWKFEQMMDKLEKSSGQTVVTLNEAKLLLERHDDLVTAVYDYWLNKRLTTVSVQYTRSVRRSISEYILRRPKARGN